MKKLSLLKQFRLNAGLTQTGLGEILDIPMRTIQEYERLESSVSKRIDKILQFSLENDLLEVKKTTSKKLKAHRAIEKYISENPLAQWPEIFRAVPSHYKDHKSMRSAFNQKDKS